MQQFLFVVDMPNNSSETRWFDFAKVANAIQMPHGSQKMPCKNAWIFPSLWNEKLQRELANSADEHQLNHSTFLISGEITSLTSQPEKHTLALINKKTIITSPNQLTIRALPDTAREFDLSRHNACPADYIDRTRRKSAQLSFSSRSATNQD